jgi:hypothetical protein
MATDTPAPRFDPHGFSNQPYVKRVTKPWGYELHWVAPDAPYMGKVLHIIEGARLSLQIHDEKQESWLLIRGSAAVIWENAAGELIQTNLEPAIGHYGPAANATLTIYFRTVPLEFSEYWFVYLWCLERS